MKSTSLSTVSQKLPKRMKPPQNNSLPRVFIVDDHPLYCTVLAEILRESGEFDVIGSANDGAAADEFIRGNEVDLLLLDMVLPGVTGMEILATLRDLKKPTKAVVFSGLGSDASIASAFSLGAAAYIEKKTDTAEIVATLRAVVRGEFPLNARTSQVLRDMVRQNLRCKPLAAVDIKVLKGLARHASIKEIAHNTGVSISGVYKARARIVGRTGTNNWEGFAMAAASYGLIPSNATLAPLGVTARGGHILA